MSEPQGDVFFVNTLEVRPGRYEQLMEILEEGNDTVVRKRDGFVSCVLLSNADRTRVLTIARWRSMAAIKATGSDPVLADFAKRTAAVATASPEFLSVVAEYKPPEGDHS